MCNQIRIYNIYRCQVPLTFSVLYQRDGSGWAPNLQRAWCGCGMRSAGEGNPKRVWCVRCG